MLEKNDLTIEDGLNNDNSLEKINEAVESTTNDTKEKVSDNLDIIIFSDQEIEQVNFLITRLHLIEKQSWFEKNKNITSFINSYNLLSDKAKKYLEKPYVILYKSFLTRKIVNNIRIWINGYDKKCYKLLDELIEKYPDNNIDEIRNQLNIKQSLKLDNYLKNR